jgi:hypothetical protein
MGGKKMAIKLRYHVDIVFCIDCTESMDNILDIVKSHALHFYEDVQYIMAAEDKEIDQLRLRVVAFRDYLAFENEKDTGTHSNQPMLVTDFFMLPDEANKFQISVKSLQPVGGGDDPEDGLEALAYAIRSDWDMQGHKSRHVIVLWTDAVPHPLGYGRESSAYPRGMAKDLGELTQWWGDNQMPGYMPDQDAKRLILYAPDAGEWKYISDNWDQVIHYPSEAGKGLQEYDYKHILACIAQSI